MSKESVKKATKSSAVWSLVYSIASILLAVAFCGGCVIVDLMGIVPRATTVGLCFAGLIFGFIGLVWSNLVYSDYKGAIPVISMICSIVSLIVCVYSVILYLDMISVYTSVLNYFNIL